MKFKGKIIQPETEWEADKGRTIWWPVLRSGELLAWLKKVVKEYGKDVPILAPVPAQIEPDEPQELNYIVGYGITDAGDEPVIYFQTDKEQ